MARRGHEVSIFTTSVDSKDHIEEFEGMRIYRYGTNLRLNKAFFGWKLFTKPAQHDVDIVHIKFTTPPGTLAGWRYAQAKYKPYVITYHGDSQPNYGNLIRRVGLTLFDNCIVDRVLSGAGRIIARSNEYVMQSRFLARHQDKITVIPCAVYPEEIELPYSKEECKKRLSIPTDEKIILFVGNLINYKSPDLLVKAMPMIIEKVPSARLVLLGEGSMQHDLHKIAKELNVVNDVRFAGHVVGESKALYFNAADVFVLPSTGRTESFGNVLLEAAAAGLPIVVSSLDTFSAFIKDGYNGLVAQIGDAASLADKINILLSDPSLKKELGANARESVKDYSWANTAQKVADIYEAVLKSRGI